MSSALIWFCFKNQEGYNFLSHTIPGSTYSSIAISEGISDHRRAYFTGVTCSWGSRSTCIWSISRQKDALRSYGKFSSDMQRRMRSTSSWPDISFMAKYCRSRHILAKRFSWYLQGEKKYTKNLHFNFQKCQLYTVLIYFYVSAEWKWYFPVI